MLLLDIARTSEALATTSARLTKIGLLADCLRRAEPAEVPLAVAFLSGVLPQRQIGVGYAALRELPAPRRRRSLTVGDVDDAFARIGAVAGPGSTGERRRLLADLFGRATSAEQSFLRGLLTGELRQGALDGLMAEAVARAAEVPGADVRRALMLRGSLGAVAEAALGRAWPGCAPSGSRSAGRCCPCWRRAQTTCPLRWSGSGPAAVEWKLDGVRIQVHRAGDDIAVFTRTLDDITARVPEVVAAARALPVAGAVLDGEVIALRPDGRPHPFQVTASRVGSRSATEQLRASVPLTAYLFDALHLDGADLLDQPDAVRHAALASVVPEALRMPRLVTEDPAAAESFLRGAVERGHEGVVVKSLTAPYAAGRRGAGWLKVKPVHTLDLVVLAVEWGHGRRRGWLSNLHLGALDPDTGGYVMLGKTFKGMTDEMLTWQTQRLLELQTASNDWVVEVRPELVVEVAFDGLQRSPRYPGGLALRFARVLRYRPDKRAADADTIATVRAIAAGQA